VLGVGDGVTNDVGEEVLEDGAGLLVDQSGHSLHPTAASEAADRRARDALDVSAEHLAVALGSAQSFACGGGKRKTMSVLV
jgi:hypothetical protein